jgi:hypothetical protein
MGRRRGGSARGGRGRRPGGERQEELERLEQEAAEAKDRSVSDDFADWLVGSDSGAEGAAAHAARLEDGYRASVAEGQAARDDAGSGGGALGTIFGGPLIGTQLGEAIGSPADSGSEDAAARSGAWLSVEAIPDWVAGDGSDDDDDD